MHFEAVKISIEHIIVFLYKYSIFLMGLLALNSHHMLVTTKVIHIYRGLQANQSINYL